MAANVQHSLRSSILFEATPYHASPFQRKLKVGLKSYYIIHDLDQNRKDRRYTLECQLEYAMERKYPTIVLECRDLGFEVVRWIRMGNFLHKSSVLTGLFSLTALGTFPTPICIYSGGVFGIVSLVCAGLYSFSWQYDPCCKYQIDYGVRSLSKIPRDEFSKPQQLFILVYRNDRYRKRLHNCIALFTLGLFAWQVYRYVYS